MLTVRKLTVSVDKICTHVCIFEHCTLYMYIIRHVNMQHIHEIFAQLIFLTRRRHACTTVVVITTKITFVM